MKTLSKRNRIVAGIVGALIVMAVAGAALSQASGGELYGTTVTLKIYPEVAMVGVGQRVQLSVSNADSSCHWSTNSAMVSLSPALGPYTYAVGMSAGTATVTANCTTGTSSRTVTVTPLTPTPLPTPTPYPPPRLSAYELNFCLNIPGYSSPQELTNQTGDPNCTWTVITDRVFDPDPNRPVAYLSGTGSSRIVSRGTYGIGRVNVFCPASGRAASTTVNVGDCPSGKGRAY